MIMRLQFSGIGAGITTTMMPRVRCGIVGDKMVLVDDGIIDLGPSHELQCDETVAQEDGDDASAEGNGLQLHFRCFAC
jgi:hypothetical protein